MLRRIQSMVILLILILAFCFQPSVSAEKPTVIFLRTEPGVRFFSMGGVSNSGDYTDAFFNPWELGWVVNKGVNFSKWEGAIEGSYYNFISSVISGKRGAFGFGYLDYSAGEETIEELDGTLRNIKLEQNRVFFISYGRGFGERLSMGGSIKYLTTTLAEEFSAEALLADVGFSIHSLDERHKVSVGVKNFGQKIKYINTLEPPPTTAYAGYAVTFKPFSNHKLTVSISMSRSIYDEENTFSGGIEYYPGMRFISLRGGVKSDGERIFFLGGVGLDLFGLQIHGGYGIKGEYLGDPPFRVSASLITKPRLPSERAEKYLERGMQRKALAMWKDIQPGEREYVKAQSLIEKHRLIPPIIALTSPQDGEETEEESILLEGRVADDKGIKAVRIYINGEPLDEKWMKGIAFVGKEERRFSHSIPLPEVGENEICIVAIDIDGLEERKEVRVRRIVKEVLPRLWALFVGVSGYSDDRIPSLNYAHLDAKGLYEFFIKQEGKSFAQVEAKVLLNEEATRENIMANLGYFLPKCVKGDVVLVSLSGHGEMERGEYFFLNHDAAYDNLFGTAVKMNDIKSALDRIVSEKIILLTDTCHASGVEMAMRRRASEKEISEFYRELVASEGRVAISASTATEDSLECSKLQHGVFTHFLLEGLKGNADTNEDGIVGVLELYQYIERRVSEYTRGAQHPQLFTSIRGDIPLAVYPMEGE